MGPMLTTLFAYTGLYYLHANLRSSLFSSFIGRAYNKPFNKPFIACYKNIWARVTMRSTITASIEIQTLISVICSDVCSCICKLGLCSKYKTKHPLGHGFNIWPSASRNKTPHHKNKQELICSPGNQIINYSQMWTFHI